ncbi:hypothetical protein FLK61_41535 [Paenalkalicoccus suaedae]|uniref:Uncharacterized protein n=1 Tax=Paenalkalicoccus suaedae TaxID=2592382 RepID=A0A859FJV0_9BACI|nr:hypothetical protein [Paenalkalicoccus suaedae]QKS73074.1 hypothetical protein FLK61_41535 [Paenalkalicoccus suaedae]
MKHVVIFFVAALVGALAILVVSQLDYLAFVLPVILMFLYPLIIVTIIILVIMFALRLLKLQEERNELLRDILRDQQQQKNEHSAE